ncbi:MAG: PP2C family protein-serine/threonine phosphatase [Acidimicrobiales bacterium]
MTSTAEREDVSAARSRRAQVFGWCVASGGFAAAVGALLAGKPSTVALGIASAGVLVALALSAAFEQRARDRLRGAWLDRLHQLTVDLAGVVDAAEPFQVVQDAADRARAGGDGPRAMADERAAFTRSVADQCAQALERLELHESRRQARDDLELLARASPALAASLDVQRIAATLEDLVVPLLADTCSLRVGRERAAAEGVARSNGSASDDGHRCTIPLRAQSDVVGELTIYRHVRPVSPSEQASVRMLAEPAARALAHALRFSEQVRTSDTLQHSLLPDAILPVPNLEVATRYLAATEGQAVGGDFYDAVRSPRGGAVLVVGDVQGKGVEAAALTSTARHTLRTAALEGDSPATMLHRLNRALLYLQAEWTAASGERSVRFVTLAVVALTPTATGFRAAVASGGHPPPIVVRPSGAVEQLTTEGPLLGVFETPTFVERTVDLALSDVLVLYTDGVTEQREQPDVFDEAQLGRLVRNMLTARHAEAVAQLILDTVVQLNPRETRDDIALLVARVVGPR